MKYVKLRRIIVLQFVFEMRQYVFVEPFVEGIHRLITIYVYQGIALIHEVSVCRDALLICYPCSSEAGVFKYRHERLFVIRAWRVSAIGACHNLRHTRMRETLCSIYVGKRHEIIFFHEVRRRLSFIAVDLQMVVTQRLSYHEHHYERVAVSYRLGGEGLSMLSSDISNLKIKFKIVIYRIRHTLRKRSFQLRYKGVCHKYYA